MSLCLLMCFNHRICLIITISIPLSMIICKNSENFQTNGFEPVKRSNKGRFLD